MPGEIITLGLGNYGVLTAAHWANSTTRYDLEHHVVYRDNGRSGPTVRLLLLDHAQPSRIRKVFAPEDPAAVEEVPTDLQGDEDDEEEGEGHHEWEDDSAFTWTWDTATRHPNAQMTRFTDPHQTDDGAAAAAAGQNGEGEREGAVKPKVEVEDAALAKELRGAPPQTSAPWWRYISVPTDRHDLLTNTYFDDPMGGILGRSFGFGYHQSFSDSLFTEGGGRSNGRISGLDTYGDRVRRQLEDADSTQGVQLFVDGDSAFGGVACALLRHLGEEHEDVKATVAHTAFPTVSYNAEDDFARRRREEVALNRALCVSHLAEHSALYVPYEPTQWGAGLDHLHAFKNDDDVTTAAVIAAASDTALYAARQRDTAPELYQSLGQQVGLLRPGESMRVVASAVALPIYVPPVSASAMMRAVRGGPASNEPSLWSVLSGSPLLEERWAPLTHAFRGAEAAQLDSGRVAAHSVALRGIASLPDVEYPREEATIRYIFPMQSARYSARLYTEPYPVSTSFPTDRLFGAPKVQRVRGRAAAGVPEAGTTDGLGSFKIGSHLINTYQSSSYTRGIVSAAEPIMRYAKHTHGDSYGFEADEWREAIETLHAVHDTYDHDSYDRDDGDESGVDE